jgi:hypothetical protein
MPDFRGLSFKGWLVIGANTAVIALLVWIAYVLGDRNEKDFALTLLFAATGGILGWLVGFLASPYSKEESGEFSTLARTAWAFVGGFLLSKLDPLMSRLTTGDALLATPLYGGRALIFTVFLVGAAINAYIIRRYVGVKTPKAQTS